MGGENYGDRDYLDEYPEDLDAVCGGGAVGGTGVYDQDEDLPSDEESPYLVHRDSVQLIAQHSQVIHKANVPMCSHAESKALPCEFKRSHTIDEPKASSPHAHQPHIRFGKVHVRLFVSGLGDNPCVSGGVPIGLTNDWEDAEAVSIDRHVQCKPVRPYLYVPYLSQEQRLDRCLRTGSSPEEIQTMMLEVRDVQEKRMQSLPMVHGNETHDLFTFEELLNDLYNSFADKSWKVLSSWGNKIRQFVDEDEDTSRGGGKRHQSAPTDSQQEMKPASNTRQSGGGGRSGGSGAAPPTQNPRVQGQGAGFSRGKGFTEGLIAWLQPMAQGFSTPPRREIGCGQR